LDRKTGQPKGARQHQLADRPKELIVHVS